VLAYLFHPCLVIYFNTPKLSRLPSHPGKPGLRKQPNTDWLSELNLQMHDENVEASILGWTVHVFHP
jgi:hypothetical protein